MTINTTIPRPEAGDVLAGMTWSGIQHEVWRIDAALAQALLELNTENRKVRERNVARYAGALRDGDWVYNGDAIRFSVEGTLLDGQHRLLAVVRTGRPITALVVMGLDRSAQDTMDDGGARTLGDMFGIAGKARANALATVVARAAEYERGVYRVSGTLPKQRAIRFAEAHPGVADATAAAQKVGRKDDSVRPLRGVVGTWYLYVTEGGRYLQERDEFLDALSNGFGLHAAHPVYKLRQRWAKGATTPVRGGDEEALALIFKAWNAYVEGRPVKTLRYAPHESFPKLIA